MKLFSSQLKKITLDSTSSIALSLWQINCNPSVTWHQDVLEWLTYSWTFSHFLIWETSGEIPSCAQECTEWRNSTLASGKTQKWWVPVACLGKLFAVENVVQIGNHNLQHHLKLQLTFNWTCLSWIIRSSGLGPAILDSS